MVQLYYSQGSYAKARRRWIELYTNRNVPSLSAFRKNVLKFQTSNNQQSCWAPIVTGGLINKTFSVTRHVTLYVYPFFAVFPLGTFSDVILSLLLLVPIQFLPSLSEKSDFHGESCYDSLKLRYFCTLFFRNLGKLSQKTITATYL